MAKREAGFTTTLIASLKRAGVVGAYKIPDASMSQYGRMGGNKRPCDVIGALPGGRSFSCEVKQQAPNADGLALGFSIGDLRSHQKDHLAQVHELGGCAVVALVSWRPQKSGQRGFWRLHLWTWERFLELTNGGKESIPADTMRTLPYLDRQTPSQLAAYWGLPKEATPKAPEWLLPDHVRQWSQQFYQCPRCLYFECIDALASLSAKQSCANCRDFRVWRPYKVHR